MSVKIINSCQEVSLPIYLVTEETLPFLPVSAEQKSWIQKTQYKVEKNKLLLLPEQDGCVSAAVFSNTNTKDSMLDIGCLSHLLPEGVWHFVDRLADPMCAIVSFLLGSYSFSRYKKRLSKNISLVAPEGTDILRVQRIAEAMFFARDLINTPALDLSPLDLEKTTRDLGSTYGAEIVSIAGDDLLKKNLYMIHAVGRASIHEPRLIDLRWGNKNAPKVSLVGKGVCFDSGGLDIKSASGMSLMKKDMAGAASVLALGEMIMKSRINVRLRVLIPAVENMISGASFRPGDVLKSYSGYSVEVGDTDAEGRLILGDALALADEEEPDLLINIATLTGAARVALGSDLSAFFTQDETLASSLLEASEAAYDPVWRLPLWEPYTTHLKSEIADIRNIASNGLAGAIMATLFLKKFIRKTQRWAHFDICGWNLENRPWCPIGGEPQSVRALEEMLLKNYG